jgi:hypothetical protein
VSRILVFDTTLHALWAEQIAVDLALGAQVVPAPKDANAGCELALEVLDEDAPALERALEEAGVEFRRYVRGA